MPPKEQGQRGTCFVVMGFGKKTDFETGRTLDLDKTYKNIIKPAAIAAGLECKRAVVYLQRHQFRLSAQRPRVGVIEAGAESRIPSRGHRAACRCSGGVLDARKVRAEVFEICQRVLQTEKLAVADKYWVLATMAEASFGIGDDPRAEQLVQHAFAAASASWMRDSTAEQIEKVRTLLADSPLKFIGTEPAGTA